MYFKYNKFFLKVLLAFVFVFVSMVKMGKGVELFVCERCKRWLVFSKEKYGFSFKEGRKKV